MSRQSQFEQKEDGVYLGDVKVATGNADGFRMVKGQADHKEDVAKFLGVDDAEESNSEGRHKASGLSAEIKELAAALRDPIATAKEAGPVCPLPQDPALGDKTPAVVEWWYANHPALAHKRYAHRRVNRDASTPKTIDV